MKHKSQQRFRRALGLMFTILVIFLLILTIFYNHIAASADSLQVIFLDVGQGDSSLIKAPDGSVVLIDGGPDNKVLRGLGNNLPFYRRRLDFVILSHYHDDHFIGLIEIIKRYRVGTLIYSGKPLDSPLMEELIDTAAKRGVRLKTLENQANLSFDADCALSLLNPAILAVKDDPNNSLIARLDCRGRSFLFAGDNGTPVEKSLSASGWPLDSDIFKASHHGSNTSNATAFLEKISPRVIVVSVGADNRFGHPGSFFLDRAAALNIPIKRTDREGEVKFFVK